MVRVGIEQAQIARGGVCQFPVDAEVEAPKRPFSHSHAVVFGDQINPSRPNHGFNLNAERLPSFPAASK
jgi:hypothetical protein